MKNLPTSLVTRTLAIAAMKVDTLWTVALTAEESALNRAEVKAAAEHLEAHRAARFAKKYAQG